MEVVFDYKRDNYGKVLITEELFGGTFFEFFEDYEVGANLSEELFNLTDVEIGGGIEIAGEGGD